MYINSSPAIDFDSTVKLLTRYVKLYIESGELSERFAAFDKQEITYGAGFDVATVLAATKQNDGTSRAAEHGTYAPDIFTLRFTNVVGGQYAVTMDVRRVNACVGDESAVQEYAAELVESLYQGWYNDKNAAVANACTKIIAQSASSSVTVTLGSDTKQYAIDVLTAVKTAVEDIREGVSGATYGNTVVADKNIAARDIVIVMSNATAALLDANGYARTFNPDYLTAKNVVRITSNRIAEKTVLITDTRNVQVRRKYENLVGAIQNSDGSYNYFYNKYDFVEPAISDTGIVAFPFKIVLTNET